MAGAVPLAGLGLYYRGDPTGAGRKPPFLVEMLGRWQLCIAADGGLVRIVAECLEQADAEALLTRQEAA